MNLDTSKLVTLQLIWNLTLQKSCQLKASLKISINLITLNWTILWDLYVISNFIFHQNLLIDVVCCLPDNNFLFQATLFDDHLTKLATLFNLQKWNNKKSRSFLYIKNKCLFVPKRSDFTFILWTMTFRYFFDWSVFWSSLMKDPRKNFRFRFCFRKTGNGSNFLQLTIRVLHWIISSILYNKRRSRPVL